MVLPFVVTWKVREYWGGRAWVGPGVPMPTGSVVVTGVVVVGRAVVGVVVTGGVSGDWVHPETTRNRIRNERARRKATFFIRCSVMIPGFNHCGTGLAVSCYES